MDSPDYEGQSPQRQAGPAPYRALLQTTGERPRSARPTPGIDNSLRLTTVLDHQMAPLPAAGYRPLPYTIVVADVVGSGWCDDRTQLRLRADLRNLFGFALERQSLSRHDVDIQDLGDGLRLIVNARVSPCLLIDPLVPDLTDLLRDHRHAHPAAAIRLRIASHLGLLHHDSVSWAGEPLVHCTRLVDAPPVRRAIDRADRADLVLVVSQLMYDAIVRHGYGLDPTTYRPVRIAVKETTTTGWIHVPGYRRPPGVG